MDHFLYLKYQIDEQHRFSHLDKEKYVDYIPEKQKARQNFYQAWNKAVTHQEISQRNAQVEPYQSQQLGIITYDETRNKYTGTATIAGKSAKVNFFLNSPERLQANISKLETSPSGKNYTRNIRKAFPDIKELREG